MYFSFETGYFILQVVKKRSRSFTITTFIWTIYLSCIFSYIKVNLKIFIFYFFSSDYYYSSSFPTWMHSILFKWSSLVKAHSSEPLFNTRWQFWLFTDLIWSLFYISCLLNGLLYLFLRHFTAVLFFLKKPFVISVSSEMCQIQRVHHFWERSELNLLFWHVRATCCYVLSLRLLSILPLRRNFTLTYPLSRSCTLMSSSAGDWLVFWWLHRLITVCPCLIRMRVGRGCGSRASFCCHDHLALWWYSLLCLIFNI